MFNSLRNYSRYLIFLSSNQYSHMSFHFYIHFYLYYTQTFITPIYPYSSTVLITLSTLLFFYYSEFLSTSLYLHLYSTFPQFSCDSYPLPTVAFTSFILYSPPSRHHHFPPQPPVFTKPSSPPPKMLSTPIFRAPLSYSISSPITIHSPQSL